MCMKRPFMTVPVKGWPKLARLMQVRARSARVSGGNPQKLHAGRRPAQQVLELWFSSSLTLPLLIRGLLLFGTWEALTTEMASSSSFRQHEAMPRDKEASKVHSLHICTINPYAIQHQVRGGTCVDMMYCSGGA